MKRIISVFLLFCMLAGVLASCDSASDTSDVSDVYSNGEGVHDKNGENTKHTIISVGKSYESSAAPSDAYPDIFGQQLTDGQKASESGVSYTDIRMVGYTENTRISIDLGEDGKRLSGMSVRALDISKDGVELAGSVRFFGSDGGDDEWHSLGRATFEDTGDGTVSTAYVEFDRLYDYRYVRATVFLGDGLFFFIDEVEVYADVDELQKTDTVALAYKNEDIDRDAWKALSTGGDVAPKYSVNVAFDKTYKFNDCLFDERAPAATDLKTENLKTFLTDGARTGRYFGEDVWIGIDSESPSSVTVDLGKSTSDLFAFRAYMLSAGTDVAFPDYIDIYGSENDDGYVLLGRVYAPFGQDNHTFTLIMQEYVRARYIRFSFPAGIGNYWIEELEVYKASDTAPTEVYPPLSFPAVTEEQRWSSSEADYYTKQNLLRGLIQQIACAGYVDPTEELLTAVDSPVLTDGSLASDMYCYSGGWFYAKCGDAVDFVYDIGCLSSIESLKVSLLEQTEWGISRPKNISVFLSENGEDWYGVGEYVRGNETLNSSATRLTFDFDTDTPYAARFVRFRFLGGMTFIDELEAFGTKAVSGNTARLSDSGIASVKFYTNYENAQYATSESTGVKASEIRCTYGNGGEGTLLPYVAYLDEEGNIQDTFIDGYIYGISGVFPSGGQAHTYSYKSDWEYIFDTVFNGVTGLDELEKTVGTVKQALNIPDYKVYVYITVTGIHESVTDFGDVDGDGVSEDLSKQDDRAKVINWYTDTCIAEFEKRGYENIELDGFYWQLEAVTWEVDDSHIIKEAADLVHEKNTNFLWVPYYTANRYHQGYEFGFDLVCMQPNFMFDLTQPLYRLEVTAARTKLMNMCVEIEHSYQALSDPDYVRNYMMYLYYGAVYGYMDATHVYYDDIANFAELAYSDDPLCRMQYDATYKFAKGTLDVTPRKRDTVKVTASKDEVYDGELSSEGEFALYTLAGSASHGSVTLSADGTFRYFPKKGFTGTDTFTYTYNNYLGESVPCTVEITVE